MLYHVPDRRTALSEIRRVLRRGGAFHASTVGERHMRELIDAIYGPGTPTFGQQCGLNCEHGGTELEEFFSAVHCYPNEGEFHITDVRAVTAYALSSGPDSPLMEDQKLVEFVE